MPIPVVTVVGMSVPPSIVKRRSFAAPSRFFQLSRIGSLMVTAINGHEDYTSYYRITVMIAAANSWLLNILTDVAYGILDPRISCKWEDRGRNEKREKRKCSYLSGT